MIPLCGIGTCLGMECSSIGTDLRVESESEKASMESEDGVFEPQRQLVDAWSDDMNNDDKNNKETMATLAGGCFWCLEAVYQEVRGVSEIQSGYCGGSIADPSYEAVCSGQTGHAEAVQLTFDPDVVSYRDLLVVFFLIHDPTNLNRQGADVGAQYRSAIFYHSDAQKQIAAKMMVELEAQNLWPSAIVTELLPLDDYFPAEEYHRRYYERNSQQPYCTFVIAPKLIKLRKEALDLLGPVDGSSSS